MRAKTGMTTYNQTSQPTIAMATNNSFLGELIRSGRVIICGIRGVCVEFMILSPRWNARHDLGYSSGRVGAFA
jgi:hypothetical protein